MKAFCLIFIRFLALIKWLFQSSGILLSLLNLEPNHNDIVIIAVVSAALIIIPELIMGSFLWILSGLSSITKNDNNKTIQVFDSKALAFSSYHFIACLSSLAFSLGLLLKASLLFGGITFITCILSYSKLKEITDRYIQINF